jgi:co-chaperonin GroES (HSP10)
MSDPGRHVPLRVIAPIGMRVLVRLVPPDHRNAAGLYLPKSVEPRGRDASFGEVIEVARADAGDQDLEGANVSGIPAGSFVLFAPDSGFTVPWDDSLRLVDTKDVLAVVEQIAPDAVQ